VFEGSCSHALVGRLAFFGAAIPYGAQRRGYGRVRIQWPSLTQLPVEMIFQSVNFLIP